MTRRRWTAAVLLLLSVHAGPTAHAADEGGHEQDLERVEAIREIKDLRVALAQDIEAGRWESAAGRFAQSGVVDWGEGRQISSANIERDLRSRFAPQAGGGSRSIHTPILLSPVVTLSADGRRANGRWHEITMIGIAGADARWEGGIYEDEYVLIDGAWKIARLGYHPVFRGSYAQGWRNVDADQDVVPSHYDAGDLGVPAITARGFSSSEEEYDRTITAQIAALADADAVRNLQHAYGYYVDRKMWDDVADLFDGAGSYTIGDQELARGRAAIRRALEADGEQGLEHGELNEHIQANMLVCVSADGATARARGLDLGMTGHNEGAAYWSLALFENSYIKRDGIWRIADMRLIPRLKADFAEGWGRSDLLGPTRLTDTSVERPFTCPDARPTRASALSLEQAELELRKAAARDAIENLSSGLGNYIDDFEWAKIGSLFTEDGRREAPALGFYVGSERITQVQQVRYGPRRSPRTFIPIHHRTQPVISISEDGRTAKLRVRLFQVNTSRDAPGTLMAAIYEDELAFDGTRWKFTQVEIDHYLQTVTYEDGWTAIAPGTGQRLTPSPADVLREYPPDAPNVGELFPSYPAVGPMWFHYVNPVSGRRPDYHTPKTGVVASGVPTPP